MKAPHSFVYRDKTHEFEKNKGVNMNQQLIFFGDHISRKPRSVDTMQKGLRVMGYYTKTVVYGHDCGMIACSPLIESYCA